MFLFSTVRKLAQQGLIYSSSSPTPISNIRKTFVSSTAPTTISPGHLTLMLIIYYFCEMQPRNVWLHMWTHVNTDNELSALPPLQILSFHNRSQSKIATSVKCPVLLLLRASRQVHHSTSGPQHCRAPWRNIFIELRDIYNICTSHLITSHKSDEILIQKISFYTGSIISKGME